MRKLTLLLLLGAVALFVAGCPDGPPPPPPEEPTTDTTATADTTPPPPPPPPPPEPRTLKDEQLQTVYFDFDKAILRSDAKASLDKNYQLLTEFPDAIVQIQGHCDERGTVEYNLALGERRAKAVQTYLITLGVDKARLQTISYGKERPAVQGSNEDAWAKNRRCEFVVISQ